MKAAVSKIFSSGPMLLFIGLAMGSVVTWSLHAWQERRDHRTDDLRTWIEYVELLGLAEELSKDRESINLETTKEGLIRRLAISKHYAEFSRDHSETPFQFFGDDPRPMLDSHIEAINDAIDCLETGRKFREWKND
jgi:hypothetical protein